MSASSTDSWILISLTVLVVLLLFYLSKKMICNSTASSANYAEADPISTAGESNSSGQGDEGGGESGESGSSPACSSMSFSDYLRMGEAERGRISLLPEPPQIIYGGEYGREENNNGESCSWSGNNNVHSYCYPASDYNNGCGHISIIGGGHQQQESRRTTFTRPNSITFSQQRKDLLEGQLRAQVGRITEAEKEIKRLVQLLAIGEGLDLRSYILSSLTKPSSPFHNLPTRNFLLSPDPAFTTNATFTAATASAAPNHYGLLPPPTNLSTKMGSTITSTSEIAEESNGPSQISLATAAPATTFISPPERSSESVTTASTTGVFSPSASATATVAADDDNFLPNDLVEVTPVLSQPSSSSSSGSHSQSQSESFASSPSAASTPTASSFPLLSPNFLQQSGLSPTSNLTASVDGAALSYHHLPFLLRGCRCNLCLAFTSTANYRGNTSRRMLMLHRMLLPSPNSPSASSSSEAPFPSAANSSSHLHHWSNLPSPLQHQQQWQNHQDHRLPPSYSVRDSQSRDHQHHLQHQHHQTAQLSLNDPHHHHQQQRQQQHNHHPSSSSQEAETLAATTTDEVDVDCDSHPPPPSYEECIRNGNIIISTFSSRSNGNGSGATLRIDENSKHNSSSSSAAAAAFTVPSVPSTTAAAIENSAASAVVPAAIPATTPEFITVTL